MCSNFFFFPNNHEKFVFWKHHVSWNDIHTLFSTDNDLTIPFDSKSDYHELTIVAPGKYYPSGQELDKQTTVKLVNHSKQGINKVGVIQVRYLAKQNRWFYQNFSDILFFDESFLFLCLFQSIWSTVLSHVPESVLLHVTSTCWYFWSRKLFFKNITCSNLNDTSPELI